MKIFSSHKSYVVFFPEIKLIKVEMDLVKEDEDVYVCGLQCPKPFLMLLMLFSGHVDCPALALWYQYKQCGKYAWCGVLLWLSV